MAKTKIHAFVERARSKELPNLVSRMPSGWLIFSEQQVVDGYCLLLPDPVVSDLNALQGTERASFLFDMTRVGDALLRLSDAVRINYEMLGNLEPALHAHIIPRYADELQTTRYRSIFAAYDFSAAKPFTLREHGALVEALRQELEMKG